MPHSIMMMIDDDFLSSDETIVDSNVDDTKHTLSLIKKIWNKLDFLKGTFKFSHAYFACSFKLQSTLAPFHITQISTV